MGNNKSKNFRTFADKPRKKYDAQAFAKKTWSDKESKKKLFKYLIYDDLFPKLGISESNLDEGVRLPSLVEGLLKKTYAEFNYDQGGLSEEKNISEDTEDFIKAFYNSDKAAKIALLYGTLKGLDVTNVGTEQFQEGEMNLYGFEVDVDPRKGITFYDVNTKKHNPLGFIENFLLDKSDLVISKIQLKDINEKIQKLEAIETKKAAFEIEFFIRDDNAETVHTIPKNRELEDLKAQKRGLETYIASKEWKDQSVIIEDIGERVILEKFLDDKSVNISLRERLKDSIKEDAEGNYDIRLIDATDVEAMYEFLHSMIKYYASGVDNAQARGGRSKEFFQQRKKYYFGRMRKHKEGIASIIAKYKPYSKAKSIIDIEN